MKKIGKINYEKIIRVPLKTINTVIGQYCNKVPDFISVDVEGLDLAILQSLNFDQYRPLVICVETLVYDKQQNEYKRQEVMDFLQSKGYSIYADTHVNTIFLLKK